MCWCDIHNKHSKHFGYRHVAKSESRIEISISHSLGLLSSHLSPKSDLCLPEGFLVSMSVCCETLRVSLTGDIALYLLNSTESITW